MKILIVAKTRRGSAACIGAKGFDGRSLRLVAPPGDEERWGHDCHVGGVWEIEAHEPEHAVPPHVENLVVTHHHRIAPMPNPIPFIERTMDVDAGGLDDAMRARCLAALVRLGTHALRQAFDDLEGAVPYPELRILALHLQCRKGEAK